MARGFFKPITEREKKKPKQNNRELPFIETETRSKCKWECQPTYHSYVGAGRPLASQQSVTLSPAMRTASSGSFVMYGISTNKASIESYQVKSLLGVTLRWTNIPTRGRGSSNTLSSFLLKKLGWTPAAWVCCVSFATLPVIQTTPTYKATINLTMVLVTKSPNPTSNFSLYIYIVRSRFSVLSLWLYTDISVNNWYFKPSI